MRRGTIVLLVFILAAGAIIGFSQFLRAQPPLEITLAVNPLAEAWVRSAMAQLNASEPVVNSTRRFRVNVVVVEDAAVWLDERRVDWTQAQHPTAWIPASSASVQYAAENRVPFEIVAPSLAQTPLMWGGFASRVGVLSAGGSRQLDWQAVATAAQAEAWSELAGGQANWGFVKLAFQQPAQAMSGLGALFSAAGDFANTTDLSAATADSGFRDWFARIAASVPNFNTLGGDPAAAMASRGASVAELALLPESLWLLNLQGLLKYEPVELTYPEYSFVLDFPLARWQDTTVTEEQRLAVEAIADWMLAPARQRAAADSGLRPALPAEAEALAESPLFQAAQPYGVQLTLPPAEVVSPPPRIEAQRLLQWFAGLN